MSMRAGVRDLTHNAKLREWYTRVMECRGSGMSVKDWCKARDITPQTYYRWEREIAGKVASQYALTASESAEMLVKINPDDLPSGDDNTIEATITIRHGESEIIMPAGSGAEAIADLVNALNRHV